MVSKENGDSSIVRFLVLQCILFIVNVSQSTDRGAVLSIE